MLISIITLFPEMFESVFASSIPKRAQEEGLITINYVNLRDFGIGKHKTVDDTPYGGGIGMVLKVDVIDRAIQATRKNEKGELVALLDPKGETYAQETAENLSKLSHLILICGHYEGVDERVRTLVDREISIGDYVLSGGEIPAMVVAESVIRLIPGVLKKEEAASIESFSLRQGKSARLLEHPQYTRPPEYKGMKVPDILFSGHKAKIEQYRKEQAVEETKKRKK